MTNEELQKIRNKYNELKDKRTEILKIGEAIEEYEQHPAVKKYLELLEIYEKNTTGRMQGFDKKTDGNLLYSTLCSIRIDETNNIYVYMGTFERSNECDIVHGPNDYRVNKDDPKADYRIYRNLELASYQNDYEIEVPIKKCEVFEKEHTVIYPQGTCLYDRYYNQLKDEFFETAISESQEKAVERVLAKRKK